MELVSPFAPDVRNTDRQKIPFEDFYNRYSGEVFGYLLKKTGSADSAEDLTSEIFLYCFEHYESYDPEKSALSTWLYLVVNSRLKNHYRDRKETVDWSELEEVLFSDVPDMERAVFLDEMRVTLAACIRESLSEVQQKVILMRFFGNRDFADIALELGTSAGNVRVIQTRALAKLCKSCREAGLSVEDLEMI